MRANFLIFWMGETANSDSKEWCIVHGQKCFEFKNQSRLEALKNVCTDHELGFYAQDDFREWPAKQLPVQTYYVLDPHFVNSFMLQHTHAERIGVFIKRKILAAKNFSVVVPLADG